ncbi:MAG: hypothetical protein MI923_09270 [Phycisphaerales bacterium]|nr:hypothetical protein [Phycisphaerales bacterium]
MQKRFLALAMSVFTVSSLTACVPSLGDFFPDLPSSSFIARGTFEERPIPFVGSCPVWVDSTNVVYHLFQGFDVPNADFDRVTTPGVSSRLRLRGRDDLQVGCEMDGIIVEVEAIVEIIN